MNVIKVNKIVLCHILVFKIDYSVIILKNLTFKKLYPILLWSISS